MEKRSRIADARNEGLSFMRARRGVRKRAASFYARDPLVSTVNYCKRLIAGLYVIDSVGDFLQGLFGVADVSSGSSPGFVAILTRTEGKGVDY